MKNKLYDDIWKAINQPNCDLHLNGSDLKDELDPMAIKDYFIDTSNYEKLYFSELTQSSQELLSSYGLSLKNLRLIKHSFEIASQEKYIGTIEKLFNIDQSKKIENSATYPHRKGGNILIISGTILVETGYIYTICPWTGKAIRSNQSFIIPPFTPNASHLIYRFVGKGVFYLIFGSAFQKIVALYFPNKEIIIYFHKKRNILKNFEPTVICGLKSYLVSNRKKIITYLKTSEKQVAVVTGCNRNFGHSYWNDLSGIHTLCTHGLVDRVSKFLVGPYNTMDPGVCFPEIPESKIERFEKESDLQQALLENNYVGVRVVDFYIRQDLVNRVKEGSARKLPTAFREKVEQAKQDCHPLLWFGIRTGDRRGCWKSQVEGIGNIINQLYLDYPNMGIVFDGWSRLSSVLGEKDKLMIGQENEVRQKIEYLLPDRVKTYNLIGSTPYEKVIFADAITTYIVSFGSSLTIVSWIADKVGVSYEGTGMLKKPWRFLYEAGFRENMISSVRVIPVDLVKNIGKDYDCDWKWIYNEVLEILKDKQIRCPSD